MPRTVLEGPDEADGARRPRADVERLGVRALHTLAPARVAGGAQAGSSRGAVGRRKPRSLGSI